MLPRPLELASLASPAEADSPHRDLGTKYSCFKDKLTQLFEAPVGTVSPHLHDWWLPAGASLWDAGWWLLEELRVLCALPLALAMSLVSVSN